MLLKDTAAFIEMIESHTAIVQPLFCNSWILVHAAGQVAALGR
jgi:hypothetical protein